MNLEPVPFRDSVSAEKTQGADALLRKYSLYAMGYGLIPAAVIDMLAVTALESG